MSCAIVYSRLNLAISREATRGFFVCVCVCHCTDAELLSAILLFLAISISGVQMKCLQHMYQGGRAWQYNFPAFNSNLEPFWKDVEFFKCTERPQSLWVPSH